MPPVEEYVYPSLKQIKHRVVDLIIYLNTPAYSEQNEPSIMSSSATVVLQLKVGDR